MKAYTTIGQSRKLAEILPLESADMIYVYDRHLDKLYGDTPYVIGYKVLNEDVDIPCWSLTALLSVLPEGTRLLKSATDNTYHCDCPKGNVNKWFDNPIDAAFEMICWLLENKKI